MRRHMRSNRSMVANPGSAPLYFSQAQSVDAKARLVDQQPLDVTGCSGYA